MIDGKEKISYQIIYYLLSLILPYQIQKKNSSSIRHGHTTFIFDPTISLILLRRD